MDFGDVVLEHRPIVICQCKLDMCAICNIPKEEHLNNEEAESTGKHNYYQRSKVWGPRVVIDQISKRGKCNDCGREYIVAIEEVKELAAIN